MYAILGKVCNCLGEVLGSFLGLVWRNDVVDEVYFECFMCFYCVICENEV